MISITRQDLSPGYQAVQSSHALLNFIFTHPELSLDWYNNSNYLCQVSCKDEEMLKQYIDKCVLKHIKHVIFREPDYNNEITAIALEPSLNSKKLISNLPLMLKK